MNLCHKPLIMSNKAWPLQNLFLREVSKFFKCYVLVKSFDRKPVLSLKTPKIGFFNTLLYQRFSVLLAPLNVFFMAARTYLYI